jgi:hypothetical protein
MHLRVREVAVLALHDSRQLHAVGRVADHAVIAHGVLEHDAEHAVVAARGGWCGPRRDLGEPLLDAGVCESGELGGAPLWNDRRSNDRLVAVAARRLQLHLCSEPLLGPLTYRDARLARGDELPARLRDVDVGEEEFSLALGLETALVGLRVVGQAVPDPIPTTC